MEVGSLHLNYNKGQNLGLKILKIELQIVIWLDSELIGQIKGRM